MLRGGGVPCQYLDGRRGVTGGESSLSWPLAAPGRRACRLFFGDGDLVELCSGQEFHSAPCSHVRPPDQPLSVPDVLGRMEEPGVGLEAARHDRREQPGVEWSQTVRDPVCLGDVVAPPEVHVAVHGAVLPDEGVTLEWIPFPFGKPIPGRHPSRSPLVM